MRGGILGIPVSIVRGGTSKGIFIMEEALPEDQVLRDQVILKIFGSPDIRQIDGLGGADVLTSKVAIVGPGRDERADVDYTFGQVSITEPFIDYGGNCGNISSAVGGFAIDHGLVEVTEPVTTVRIRLTNTNRIVNAYIPVKDGRAEVYGDYSIDGVPGNGAGITLDWAGVCGGITGKLLPTGQVRDTVEAGGREYTVSVVDAGNVVIFIEASALGLKGTETPATIEDDRELMDRIEEIRGKICVKLGMVKHWSEAEIVTPYQPFFAMVSRPRDHLCFNGREVKQEQADIVSRMVFMLHMHKAYPITGTVATGAAFRIPGTVVRDLVVESALESGLRPKWDSPPWMNLDSEGGQIRIAHPSGVLSVNTASRQEEGHTVMTRLEVLRTARTIMDGTVYIKLE